MSAEADERDLAVALAIADPALADRIAVALAGRSDLHEVGEDSLAEADVVIADSPPDTERPVIALVAEVAALRDWRADIRAVLPPAVAPQMLAAAIHAVAAGLAVVPPAVLHEAFLESAARGPDDVPDETAPTGATVLLTPREREALELLAEGASNKLIARRLGISVHTAKFHVASLLAKLGATSRTDAVLIGVRQGLVML